MTKHGNVVGQRKSPTYQSWQAMIRRCTNQSVEGWENYGGRGISVCDRWRDSFANFLADMGERPLGTSIDRINNDRGYEIGNCRWATRKEQGANRSTTKLDWFTVALIRHMHRRGETGRGLGHAFGVSHGAVFNVISRRTW